MISEPQRTYLLELFAGLGPAARHFVLVGAQAMKFVLPRARATRDFDFVLDVAALRALDLDIECRLTSLGFQPVEGARYFQFQEPIPGSAEEMRIEFMGPEIYRRKGNIRVKVQAGLHARGCIGAEIALRESAFRELEGQLPSGEPAMAAILVAQPWALVMLKCLAMDERYRNVRGLQQCPGLLLYLELETRQSVSGVSARVRALVERAQGLVAALVQPPSAEGLQRPPGGPHR